MPHEDGYAGSTGAELYDIAFDWRHDKEADFAEACVDAFGQRTRGPVLDVACGGGHFLAEMRARGWPIAGVDISPEMIGRARSRLGDECALEVACMSQFGLSGPFDLATCWYDSLPYLLTNDDIVRHLRLVASVLARGGIYLADMGFGRWADAMWSTGEAEWVPDFSNGWTARRGDLEVYHDGCDGPPCDRMAHVCTEYMFFRATDRSSGAVSEHTFAALKRALHPQEFVALTTAAGALDIAGWFGGGLQLADTFDQCDARGRGVVVMRKRAIEA